jgi:hypothetical protein
LTAARQQCYRLPAWHLVLQRVLVRQCYLQRVQEQLRDALQRVRQQEQLQDVLQWAQVRQQVLARQQEQLREPQELVLREPVLQEPVLRERLEPQA